MKSNREILTSMLHTVQMGQTGIRCIMDNAVKTDLKAELKDQLREYDMLEKETLQVAQNMGLELKNLHPALETMSNVMSKMQLIGGDADSKIAGMLIQGNTRGMILGLKNLRKAANIQPQVQALAQKIINRENINIQKSQPFL